MEYKIVFKEMDALGKPIGKLQVRKFGADKHFSIPTTEHGMIKIIARDRASRDEVDEDVVVY